MLVKSPGEHSLNVGEGRKDRSKALEHRVGMRGRECWQRVVRWSLAVSSRWIITTNLPTQEEWTENAFSVAWPSHHFDVLSGEFYMASRDHAVKSR